MDALFDPVLSAGLCGEGAAGRTYDTATQSFGVSGTAPSELAKNYYAYGGGDDDDGEDGSAQKRQVRHVTDKMLVAVVPPGMKAEEEGAPEQPRQTHHDTFTGLIDVITGQPLHGTRFYSLTGEIYEGPFHPNPHPQFAGKRHGRDAVVQNLWLPDDHSGGQVPVGIGLIQNRTKSNDGDGSVDASDTTDRQSNVHVGPSHKFFGTYENDQPHHGTLITNGRRRKEIYHGPLKNHRPHTDRRKDQIPIGNVPFNALEEASLKFRSSDNAATQDPRVFAVDEAEARTKEVEGDRSSGTLARPDGYRYEGEFKMGHPEGKGVEVGPLTTFDLDKRWAKESAGGDAGLESDAEGGGGIAVTDSSEEKKGRGVYRGQYMGGLHHGIGTYSFYADAEPGKDYNPNRFLRGSNTVDSSDNLVGGLDGENDDQDNADEDVVIQDEDDFMYSKTYCEDGSHGQKTDDSENDAGSETFRSPQLDPVPETPVATAGLVRSERMVDSYDEDESSTDSAREAKPTEDPFSPSQGGLTASQLAASIDAALLSESSDESDSDDHDPRPWAKVRQDREAAADPILSQLRSDMEKAELEASVANSVSAALSDAAAKDNAEKNKQSKRPKRRRKRVLYSYSGQWYASQRHGEGTERMPSGEIYEGDFVRDLRDGYGCLSFWTRRTADIPSSIRSAAGRWSQGKPVDGATSGWTVGYLDGSKYTGYVDVDGPFAPHGYGVKRYASGDVFCGCWSHGKRNGEGVFVHKDPKQGGEIVGIWENDELLQTDGEIAQSGEAIKRTNSFVDVTKRVCERGAAGMDVIDLGGKNLSGPTIGAGLTKAQQDLQRTMVKDVMKKALGRDDVRSEAEHDAARNIRSASKDNADAETETVYFFDQKEEKKEQLPILQSYPNGDTYLGNLDNEKRRQGYGVYLSASTGSTYSGNFRSDKRHGYGILYHPKFGKYCGYFVDDMKWGDGSLILNDASTYIGGFVNNLFHGKGTLCERDGRTYVGHWKDGKREGEGIEVYLSGQVYVGMHKDGLRHGDLGTMLERSGGKVIYSGGFCKGLYHGEGKLVQRLLADPADMAAGGGKPSHVNDRGEENGKVVEYEGSFVGGQLYGYGVLRSEADGVVYKGNWDKNRPSGKKWRIEYHDGSIYSGTAKHLGSQPSTAHKYPLSTGIPSDSNDEENTVTLLSIHQQAGGLKPDGFGTMKYACGDVYVGTFVAGKREEEGQCIFANGDKWEGEWLEDRPNMDGAGTLTLADGTVQQYVPK